MVVPSRGDEECKVASAVSMSMDDEVLRNHLEVCSRVYKDMMRGGTRPWKVAEGAEDRLAA